MLARCASDRPRIEQLTPAERHRRDLVISAGLARQLESKLLFKTDKELLVYLRDLAKQLADPIEDLKESSVGVMVIEDRGSRWRDFGIQGNRIYLSSGLLKHVQYENELAAAIALEFAHILKRHVPHRLGEGRSSSGESSPTDFPSIEGLVPSSSDGAAKEIDFFSPTGIYAFSDDLLLESIDKTVEILYKAGFDPRGLVSLWALYGAEANHSPYERLLLKKLTDKTRAVIAQFSPLRNPIVRSQEFVNIQRRIKKL
jgi:hypothetical protein